MSQDSGTDPTQYLSGYDRDSEAPIPDRSQVVLLFSRATIAFDALRAQWRRGLDLTTHERQAVSHLWEAGQLSMSELGQRLSLSRAAMTALVDRLESLGYVERSVDELDRRRTLLRITDLPMSRLTPLGTPYAEDVTTFSETLSDAEWAALVRFLDHVHATCQRQTDELRGVPDRELVERCDEGARLLQGAASPGR